MQAKGIYCFMLAKITSFHAKKEGERKRKKKKEKERKHILFPVDSIPLGGGDNLFYRDHLFLIFFSFFV